MPKMALKSAVAAAALATADAAHWAVIMAGSNQYYNYRHQADACHAYQVAKAHGIPQSNIILLAYDDIASNSQNPIPGKLFNKPDGPDVYAGCEISYKGNAVTAQNFLKVLKGDSSAPGPVLKSTAEDRVFVFYSDHGATGILGTPSGDYIHAADLNSALVEMHQKGLYKELLFYVEACEAGSMFAGLITAPKVKAVTASNPQESSWGFYCPPQDTVSGKAIGSCLGDEFSINWMEDADKAAFTTETVGQQLTKVTQNVKKSHVSQYGDNSLDPEPIGNFEGSAGERSQIGYYRSAAQGVGAAGFEDSAVDSRDIEVHLAYWAVRRAGSAQQKKAAEAELQALLARRRAVDTKFLKVARTVAQGNETWAQELLEHRRERMSDPLCHKAALETTVRHCGAFTDYSLRYSRLLANLCEAGVEQPAVAAALRLGCAEPLDLEAGCTGAADPAGPGCYEGKAGALGVTESVRVNVKSFAAGKGTADVVASGIKSVSCLDRPFQKAGQTVTVDTTGCLPDGVSISSVQYCSDSDTLQVTVKDSILPVPITATLTKVACAADVVV